MCGWWFCQGRNVFPLLEEPNEGEQCCGKIPLNVWNIRQLESQERSRCCLRSTGAAGFKVKNSPPFLEMGTTILISKIRKAVLSAEALGCLHFPISPRNPAVSPLQIGFLMSEYFIQTFPLGGTAAQLRWAVWFQQVMCILGIHSIPGSKALKYIYIAEFTCWEYCL